MVKNASNAGSPNTPYLGAPPSAIRPSQTPVEQVALPVLKKDDPKGEPKVLLSRKKAKAAIIDSFTKPIQDAEAKKDAFLLIETLKKFAVAILEINDWTFSAMILNAALAIQQKSLKSNEKTAQELLALMINVEVRFITVECQIHNPPNLDVKRYFDRRNQIQSFRDNIQKNIEKGIPTKQIIEEFSIEIYNFLNRLLEEIYSIIGRPPCKYCILTLGSLGRKEMSPYSDLEFAILVDERTQANVAYFHKLVKLLEIRIIHLGETKINLLQKGNHSPINSGFSFDSGGNTPLGKDFELIQTPSVMAQLQTEQSFSDDYILSNVLKRCGILEGDAELYLEYNKAMDAIIDSPSNKPPQTIRERRALQFLSDNVKEFAPQLDKRKQETPIFEIKAELYRLINFLIIGLGDFFAIKDQTSEEKLDALAHRKILSNTAVDNLKFAVNAIMLLRIKSHLFYKRECDDAYHPFLIEKITKTGENIEAFVLSLQDLETISLIYGILVPFHVAVEKGCHSENFQALVKESFIKTNSETLGDNYLRLFKFERAKLCYQQAFALYPEDIHLLLKMIECQIELFEYKQALESASIALDAAINNSNTLVKGRAYHLLGVIYTKMMEKKKAIEMLTLALDTQAERHGSGSLEVAAVLVDLGKAHWCESTHLGSAERTKNSKIRLITKLLRASDYWHQLLESHVYKSLQYFNRALSIYKSKNSDNQEMVGLILAYLAEASYYLNFSEKHTLNTIQASLIIADNLVGASKIELEIYFIGGVLYELLGYEKAETCYQNAIKASNSFGEEHPISRTVKEAFEDYRNLRDAGRIKIMGVVINPSKKTTKLGRKAGPEKLILKWNDILLEHITKLQLQDRVELINEIKSGNSSKGPQSALYLKILATIWKKLSEKQSEAECSKYSDTLCTQLFSDKNYYAIVPEKVTKDSSSANTFIYDILYYVIETNVCGINRIKPTKVYDKDDPSSILTHQYMIRMPYHNLKEVKSIATLSGEYWRSILTCIFRENPSFKILSLEKVDKIDKNALLSLLEEFEQFEMVSARSNPFDEKSLYYLQSKLKNGSFYFHNEKNDKYPDIIAYLKKKATSGDEEAQYHLGFCFYKGRCEQAINFEEAFKWFKKSSEKGFSSATYHMGLGYELGKGDLKQSTTEAKKYYEAASKQGHELAKERLSAIVKKEQIELSEWEENKKFEAQAIKGDRKAQYKMSIIYYIGSKGYLKNHQQAAHWLTLSAKQGYPPALTHLGTFFEEGLGGITKSEVTAREYYEAGARKGDIEGQYQYAYYLFSGRGNLEKSPIEAEKWYRLAAERGHAGAQNTLGFMYEKGMAGLVRSEQIAREWYEKASKSSSQGRENLQRLDQEKSKSKELSPEMGELIEDAEANDPQAQFELGNCYFSGKNIAKSEEKAAFWIKKAADQNHPAALSSLGYLYQHGKGNLERSDTLAIKCFERSAKLGYATGQFNYAICLVKGNGCVKSAKEALVWLLRAAEHKETNAFFELGCIYHGRESPEIEKSPEKAFDYFTKAAQQEHPIAMRQLGIYYRDGLLPVERSRDLALDWFQKAASKNDSPSQFELGRHFFELLNYPRAFEWFTKAAEHEHAQAQYALALMYSKGQGVEPSNEKANAFLERAAKNGNAQAKQALIKRP